MMTTKEMIRFAIDHVPTDEKWGRDYNGEMRPHLVRAYIVDYFHESVKVADVIEELMGDDRFEVVFRERKDI